MKNINSRKGQTSITHLMSFSLPPRPQFQYHHQQNHRSTRRNPTWGLGSGYHAADKARYVHANYRFIVKPDRDYHVQSVDADIHLEWDTVLQILASAQTQAASCPICLSDTPVAPRMAKCGHIFCLPCLIRYMHSTDDANPVPEKKARWKKCPICWDSVYVSETRPVRWFVGKEASSLMEGGDVLLKLLRRDPGSTLALPRDATEALSAVDDVPWYHVAEVIDYARVMKGGEEYMNSHFDVEIEQLQEQERVDELMFGEDTTWTRKAVAAIYEAKERVKGIGNPPNEPKQRWEKRPSRPPVRFEAPEEGAPDMYAYQHAAKSGQSSFSRPIDSSSQPPPTESDVVSTSPSPTSVHSQGLVNAMAGLGIGGIPAAASRSRETQSAGPSRPSAEAYSRIHTFQRASDHPFYFYQALPNFYLSPLDIRILKAAFGDFSLFPSTILPRVEHISTGHVLDDDLRKRAKYLGHLPHGCEVSFLECDWAGSVPEEILAQFDSDVTRRRKKNREKEAREEKERVRAEKEEDDKRWAAARRKRPSATEKSFSGADFQAPAYGQTAENGAFDSDRHSTSPPWGVSRTQSSFATLASPSTSPNAPRTVWGTSVIPPGSPTLEATRHEPDGPHDDGWLQGWEKDLLDHEDNVGLVEATLAADASSRVAGPAGSTKKKKKQKITLMSTNARRAA